MKLDLSTENVIVTIIICISLSLCVYLISLPFILRFEAALEEKSLVAAKEKEIPVCSLNKLTIGQTYTVLNNSYVLKNWTNYGQDEIVLRFRPFER